MKNIITAIVFVALSVSGIAQNEKPHFCSRDTSEHKENNFAYDGYFNVDIDKSGNYYTNDQYVFVVPNDKLKDAYKVILEVDISSPKDGVYEKMGSIYCSELHAPTTKKDPTEKGKYSTTWAFKKNIEIWYNGEYIKLIFPNVTSEKYETLKAFEHSFYVKKECYQDMLNAFKPNK